MITPAQAQAALAALDAALTVAEFIGRQIAEARQAGVISIAEQEARLAKIDQIRAEVGLPKPPQP